MYKNLVVILDYLNGVAIKLALLGAVILVFIEPTYILSMVVGLLFSFIIFRQTLIGQYKVLKSRKKGLFFIHFCQRLFLHAFPLALGLAFKNYFNFFVILVFLFTYKVLYLSMEFGRSFKKYKRQRNQWKD